MRTWSFTAFVVAATSSYVRAQTSSEELFNRAWSAPRPLASAQTSAADPNAAAKPRSPLSPSPVVDENAPPPVDLSRPSVPQVPRRFVFQGALSGLRDGNYEAKVKIRGGKRPFTADVANVFVTEGNFALTLDETTLDGGREIDPETFLLVHAGVSLRMDLGFYASGELVEEFLDIPLASVGSALSAQTAMSLAPEARIPASQILGAVTASYAERAGQTDTFGGLLSGDLSGSQTTTKVDALQGTALDLSNRSDGNVLMMQGGRLTLGVPDLAPRYEAGNGVSLLGNRISVLTGAEPHTIPALDENGKLVSSVIPKLPLSALPLGENGLVQLREGLLPAGTVDATSLRPGAVNASHIAPNSIGTEHLADGAVTPIKIAGLRELIAKEVEAALAKRKCPAGFEAIEDPGTRDYRCIYRGR